MSPDPGSLAPRPMVWSPKLTLSGTRDTGHGTIYLPTYLRTYVHTYIPTYLHTYVPTYTRTYIYTYIPT